MSARSSIVISVVLAVVGCRDDTTAPRDPTGTTLQASGIAPATALAFWQVSAGGAHTCAVTTDGQAYCWGENSAGQLGIGTDEGPEICGGLPCSTRPVRVVGGLIFRSVHAGTSHTCGVTTDDRAYCWGANIWGELGDGTADRTLRRATPTAVAGGIPFRQLTAGAGYTCGRTATDVAYCWGNNVFGQLGDSSTTNRLTPVRVAGGQLFRYLSAGAQHTCGIATSGRTFCWGTNEFGQIGDSSTVRFRQRPSRVAGGYEFRQVDPGTSHTCAVTADSRAFCWGSGTSGQLGSGKTDRSLSPRGVLGGLYFARVTAGEDYTCAEAVGRLPYCWGYNGFGQLGDGTTTTRSTPVLVSGGLYFKQVDAGVTGRHTCGKTAAGTVYCWGWNLYGQLGNGTTTDNAKPRLVVDPI